MRREIAEKILTETENGYDLISGKFSQTRKKFWADLGFIGGYVKDGNRIFDFGCGNGRLFDFLNIKAKIEYWGADVSGKLIDIAKDRHACENAHFSKLDSSQTSLASEKEFFNAVYSIAVFHHIPSKELRSELAGELFRITKINGYVVVTVWNLWQKKYKRKIFRNWKEKVFSRHNNGVNNLDWNDCYISFTDNQGKVFQRFHHAFTKRELRNLFESAGFKTERCGVVGERNIVYVGKKF